MIIVYLTKALVGFHLICYFWRTYLTTIACSHNHPFTASQFQHSNLSASQHDKEEEEPFGSGHRAFWHCVKMTLCALQKGKFKAAVGDVLKEAGELSFNTTGTVRTASFPLSFAAKKYISIISPLFHHFITTCTCHFFILRPYIQFSFFFNFWRQFESQLQTHIPLCRLTAR